MNRPVIGRIFEYRPLDYPLDITGRRTRVRSAVEMHSLKATSPLQYTCIGLEECLAGQGCRHNWDGLEMVGLNLIYEEFGFLKWFVST